MNSAKTGVRMQLVVEEWTIST